MIIRRYPCAANEFLTVSRFFTNGRCLELDNEIKYAEVRQQQGICITKELAFSFVYECLKQKAPELGRRVQLLMASSGLDSLSTLMDHLIRLFASSGNLIEGNQAFNKILKPSQYTWNATIDAYAKINQGNVALDLYDKMHHDGVEPDLFTFLSILKTCISLGSINLGRYIHEQIFCDASLEHHDHVGNALLDMYAKCGSLDEAWNVFCNLSNQDVVSWNTMIAGCVLHGEGILALDCFDDMQDEGIKPSKVTFLNILKACSSVEDLEQGRLIHEQIVANRQHDDLLVGSTLVDMYAKSGSLEEACKVFERLPKRNIVSWGAIITGYAQHGGGHLALECFQNMYREGLKPDKVIYLGVLKACGSIGAMAQGRHVHEQIIEIELESDIIIACILLDIYAKCGVLEEACEIFSRLPNRNVILWSAMLAGYAQHGKAGLAISCFEEMQGKGIPPSDVAFLGLFTAFARVGLVDEGLWYFKNMTELHDIKPSIPHITCMMDILGHAGCFREGEILLAASRQPDTCFWRNLLSACRLHSNADLGRQCFNEIINLDARNPGAYVLMSNIYASTLTMRALTKYES